jgi:hypothetical protein
VTEFILQFRVFGRILRVGNAHHVDRSNCKALEIGRWQHALFIHVLVQIPADRAVGPIGPYQKICLIGGVVGAMKMNPVVLFLCPKNLFVMTDLVRRDTT